MVFDKYFMGDIRRSGYRISEMDKNKVIIMIQVNFNPPNIFNGGFITGKICNEKKLGWVMIWRLVVISKEG